ncbi:hypothetical protein OQA88_9467 [Cercophora sp. LCS_1]
MDEPHTHAEEKQAPQSTQTRKRQLDSNDDAEPRAKRAQTTRPTLEPARLTRKNLALFNKMGKKKSSSTKTKTTSTTTSGFADKARDNGILLAPGSKTPTNHGDRRERGARSRGTASPTETEHRGFVRRITRAGNKVTMVHAVIRHLLKEHDDEGYKKTLNHKFTNFPKDVGFNNGLSAPRPDLIEGLEAEEFRPFPVGNHIAGAVLYKDDCYSSTLPHLAGEWKGPDGSVRTAELRSAYDGAALVYARNQALSYLGKSDPPGHAEVTTFTTDGPNLNLYSHYAMRSEDGTLEYHQYPDESYNMKKYQEFKDGRKHVRNAQDHAKDQSYALRDQLKEHWKQRSLHPITEGVPPPLAAPDVEPPVTTQTYEDEKVVEPRAKRAQTTRPTLEPARLTRKNLALFNKMGKKKSSDPSGSTKTKTTSTTTSGWATSTTTSGFADKARNNGILPPPYSKPPKNLKDIRQQQAKSRATTSPPESVYNDYVNRVDGAGNKSTIVVETSRRLLKEYPKGYNRAFNHAFTGYPKDVGFNNGLSAPQPDFVEGLKMEEYLPFPVDERISGAVLRKDDPRSITLPHVAGEWKGSGKDMEQARMQAAYDGAALVYARNQALDAAKKPYLTGHAKVTTFTTDGRNLNLFAHYAAETEDGTLEYHQYPIKSLNLVDSYEGYKEGRKHLRNAQDYAREQSYALRDELKEYYEKQRHGGLHPVTEEVAVPDVEPPVTKDDYEDEDDHQPTPPTSTKPKHGKSHHSQSHHSHSTPHSSEAPPTTHDHAPSSGQKRKAPSSQGSPSGSSRPSKRINYWTRDTKTGRFYHKHSDGTISRLEDEDDYEVVEPPPVYQPTSPTSTKPKHSKSHHSQHSQHLHSTPHSSEAPPTTHDHAPSSGQKRKAPSSQGSSSGSSHPSKRINYWTRDRKTGRFYHKHSDGTISRLEEEDDGRWDKRSLAPSPSSRRRTTDKRSLGHGP